VGCGRQGKAADSKNAGFAAVRKEAEYVSEDAVGVAELAAPRAIRERA